MKYSVIAASVILLIGWAGSDANAGGRKGRKQVIEQEAVELMNKLDVLDERSRMRLLSQVDEQRQELLGVLLKHLGTSSSKEVQTAAIYLIGRHRLSDGVSELIELIDFDAARQMQRGPRPLWHQYPAMEALITIGKPSVKPAVELLARDGSELRRNLAVKVIRYVEGPEVSEFILQRAEADERDATRKSRLNEGLSRLRQLIEETR